MAPSISLTVGPLRASDQASAPELIPISHGASHEKRR